jgi:hypothetical protein
MAETTPAPSVAGSVVLDVGADIGALVLHTPASLDGCEIEISPVGIEVAHRTHSQVRERRIGPRVQYAAVYPGVPAGHYTIWHDAATPAGTVTISGGEVTECQWPESP